MAYRAVLIDDNKNTVLSLNIPLKWNSYPDPSAGRW